MTLTVSHLETNGTSHYSPAAITPMCYMSESTRLAVCAGYGLAMVAQAKNSLGNLSCMARDRASCIVGYCRAA